MYLKTTYKDQLYFFIFVLFAVLGPKFSALDLSIIIPFALLLLLFVFSGVRLKINRFSYPIYCCIFTLMGYQICVQLVTGNLDIVILFRLVRVLLSCLVIDLYFSLINCRNKSINILSAVKYLVFVNSCVIVVCALNLDVAHVVAEVVGQKEPRLFRSPGLLMGFDMAGFISIIGILIIAFEKKSSVLNLMILLVIVISCLFTSRTTFLLSVVMCMVYFFKVSNSKSGFTIKALSYLVAFIIISGLVFVISQVYYVMNNMDSIIDPEIFEQVFYMGTGEHLMSMYFLPETQLGILFGTGIEPDGSDVGYVRELFKYGIVGTLIVLLIYIYIALNSFGNRQIGLLIVTILVLSLVLSFKNNYFLTRNFFPLLYVFFSFNCTFNRLRS